MIINLGTISFWIGNIPLKKNALIPRFRYFDGGSYWKLSFLWFKFLLEFSGPKTDTKTYKIISKQELDIILKDLK
jgi:hypothetical protein